LQLDGLAIHVDLLNLEINPARTRVDNVQLRWQLSRGAGDSLAGQGHTCLVVLVTHPIVVIKLEVNESSAKRSSKQLFPTPGRSSIGVGTAGGVQGTSQMRAREQFIAEDRQNTGPPYSASKAQLASGSLKGNL
jgi:hypothetical protein